MTASIDGGTTSYNLIGALIFSSYVISALFLSAFILQSLFSSRQKLIKVQNPNGNRRLGTRLQIFSTLSVLSFSTLSYHMLNYLIVSYTDWAIEKSIPLPRRLFGDAGLLGGGSQGVKIQVWQWLTSSTLFQDFAQSICGNGARFWWTQQALLMTMGWSVFMSFEGQQTTTNDQSEILIIIGRKRNIKHLWYYAFISQILPLSFAQNLFFLAMLLMPIKNPNQKIWTPTPVIQLLPLATYFIFIFTIPFTAGTGFFIGVVIVIRLLLFTPFILPIIVPEGGGTSYLTPRKSSWVDAGPFGFIAICSALLWSVQTFMALRESEYSVSRITAARDHNPAVSALAYDYILSLVSLGVWAVTVGSDVP